MKINFPFYHKLPFENNHTNTLTIKLVISYSLFLFVSLILSVYLYTSAMENSKEDFWQQNESVFQSSVSILNNDFNIIDSYCRQLSQNSNLVHLSNMTSNTQKNYYFTAMKLKNDLPSQLYSFSMLPINSYYLYLKNTGYVLSINQFESEYLFYSGIHKFPQSLFETWHENLYAENGSGTMYSLTDYTVDGHDDALLYLIDVDSLSYKNIPVTAGFHISYEKLKGIFRNIPFTENSFLYVTDSEGNPSFFLSSASTIPANQLLMPEADVLNRLSSLSYHNNYASYQGDEEAMFVTHTVSVFNNWHYYLVQPDSLCVTSFTVYQWVFFFFLALASVLGICLVLVLVRLNMRPVLQLDYELKETISDRNQLKEVVETTRPIIYSTYLKQLMAGNIPSQNEFSYIKEFLHLTNPDLHYYCLYGIIYDNEMMDSDGISEENMENMDEIIRYSLSEYFSYQNTLYMFSPEERVYVLLLPFEDDESTALISIQNKVLQLHEELLDRYSIWFFAGLGRSCSLPNIWESYQQAKEASSYTAKNYIFLPYEMKKKDSHVYYYPAEFSTKLIHFVSNGDKTQVMELFNLIHQENIEERSLPIHLLKFLLSDIRNTLLKARFSLTSTPPESNELLANVDSLFAADNPTFRLCEDIALNLCDLFSSKAEENNLIDIIVAYIRKNFRDPSLCLNKISDEFHISESYFSHMFKETMGINFSVYLEDMRLNEAARLMREESGSLSEIYLEVGYNNTTSFRRAFKKKFGVTPSAMKPS